MFKRFTLLLSLAVAATVSIMAVTNLWSGSTYLEGHELEVPDSNGNMSSLSIGDKIKISFKNSEEGELKVTVNTESGQQTLFEDYHVAANTGSVSFDVTQTFLDGVKKENKFKIMAKKITITSVDAVPAEGGEVDPDPENPEEGTFSGVAEIKGLAFTFAADWYDVAKNGADARKALWIKPKYMPDVQAGDEIHVTFESDGGKANFVFLDSDNNWQKRGDNNSVDPDWIDYISKDHTYVFKIQSDTRAAEMAANGLWVDGNNNKVAKVEFVYNKHAKDIEGEIVADGEVDPENPEEGTFSGSKEIKNLTFAFGENWYDVAKNGADESKALWIKPKYMPNVQAGDEIHVTFESDGGQANFVFLDSDNNWQKRGDNNSVAPNDYFGISKSHTYVFKIQSDTRAAEMAANGLWVDGKQNKVAKVVFVYNKHAEDIEGDIVADGVEDPQPPVEENFTSRVLWQTGDQILSAKGETTSIVFDSNWMSRYGLEDGDADRLDQAFHIPAEKFYTNGADLTNADLDDCIVVTYKEANPGAYASFYFKDSLDDSVWFKRGCGDANTVVDSYTVDGTVFYRYLLNYRMVAALRHNGLWIDGNNGSEIVKVELRNYSNEALDDTFPYFTGKTKQDIDPSKADRGYVVDDEGDNRSFGYDNLKRIRPVAFTNYNNGERIILTFRPVAENAELRMQYIRPYSANFKVAQALTGTDDGILTIGAPGEDGLVDVVYRPTQREIRALKFNGLFLDGNGLELVEISFGEEEPGDMQNDIYVHNDWMTLGHDGEDGKVYEGDSYSSGQVKIYVSNSHFQHAKENNWLGMEDGEYKGYKLTFHFPWSGGAWLNLYYDANNVADANRDPLNWYYESAYGSGMPKGAPFRAPEDEPSATGTYYTINDIPAGQNVYYDQALTHDDVEKLLNYGMWIEGGNADMQSVRLRSRLSVSGVESAVEDDLTDAVIDLNLPYEAYTLDGRRVADIEASGIYIVRQGSKVVKMIRR